MSFPVSKTHPNRIDILLHLVQHAIESVIFRGVPPGALRGLLPEGPSRVATRNWKYWDFGAIGSAGLLIQSGVLVWRYN